MPTIDPDEFRTLMDELGIDAADARRLLAIRLGHTDHRTGPADEVAERPKQRAALRKR